MSTNGATVPGGGKSLELPPFSLDVQALDLGPGIKAVGLELVETENREPVRGPKAAEIWSAAMLALMAGEMYVLDFFSHVERVAEFCDTHKISFRKAAGRCWWCRNLARSSCGNFSSVLRKKLLGCAPERPPSRLMWRWKANSRSTGWTLIKTLMRGMHFARFASQKMAGSPC